MGKGLFGPDHNRNPSQFMKGQKRKKDLKKKKKKVEPQRNLFLLSFFFRLLMNVRAGWNKAEQAGREKVLKGIRAGGHSFNSAIPPKWALPL